MGATLLAIFVAIISAVHLVQAFTGAIDDPRVLVIVMTLAGVWYVGRRVTSPLPHA